MNLCRDPNIIWWHSEFLENEFYGWTLLGAWFHSYPQQSNQHHTKIYQYQNIIRVSFWTYFFVITFGLQSLVPVTAALCIITSILMGSWVPELVQIVHSYSVSEPSPRLCSSAILTSSVSITWGFHCHALQSGVCVQCEAQCCQVESGLYLGPKQFCNTVSYSGHSIFDFWSKDSLLIKEEVKLFFGGARE